MSWSSDPRPALEFSSVTAGWTVSAPPVLVDLSVSVALGEMVHLAGPNGVGKSTVVELASGYLRPRTGSVRVHGVPAWSARARTRRRIVRTSASLHPELTVAEHLQLVAARQSTPLAELEATADTLGLLRWSDAEAKTLSTGNARKLWLLVCTAGEFDLVLLDEPFNALDSTATEAVTDLLHSWRSRCAVVLVAHHLPDAVQPDRVVELARWSRREGATDPRDGGAPVGALDGAPGPDTAR